MMPHAQMSTRWRLLQAAPGAFSFDDLPRRVERFVVEVVFQGKVIAREVQLLIKTRDGRVADVERVLRAHHPYEVPEILALPVASGGADYLAWIAAETTD